MNASLNPRVTGSRAGVYSFAALALLPAIGFWLLARVVLWPRLEWLWATTGFAQYTGLSGGLAPVACAPDSMITNVRMLLLRPPMLFSSVLLALVSAEFLLPGWHRFRKPVLTAFVLACTITAFLLFTFMCMGAILAHPSAP